MQYQYTSLKDVIGNVIRNTRIQDSSFIADIHEWLYEAMDMLETQNTLEGKWEKVCIEFHKAKLPCGLKWIDAVEYNGHRLREGHGSRPAEMGGMVTYNNPFISTVDKIDTTNGHSQYVSEIKKVQQLAVGYNEYYYTEMGTINTSFCDGELMVYFRGVKVDDDGFPMIPDNQNYKQALYWYCRAMMIGAGFEDKVFTYAHCFEQWERIYGPRATAEIRMPSPEQMQHRINTFVRFLPDPAYYDNFDYTPYKEGMYDTRNRVGTNGSNNIGLYTQQPYIPGTKSE